MISHRTTEQDIGGNEQDDRSRDWLKSTRHAEFLEKLADEYERDGMPEHAPRLREDAAWYRKRFTAKDGRSGINGGMCPLFELKKEEEV